jgi:hypothetical protein
MLSERLVDFPWFAKQTPRPRILPTLSLKVHIEFENKRRYEASLASTASTRWS